jgi:hypothetical protein
MNKTGLEKATRCIRNYTAEHCKLKTAHHFVYDSPLDKNAERPQFVVMGLNPGETDCDLKDGPGPTERTWLCDFTDQRPCGPGQGSVNWRRRAKWFTHDEPFVITELFFWSSHDGKALRNQFGPLWGSADPEFCTHKNRILIEEYQPKAVIFVGIGKADRIAEVFEVRHKQDVWKEYRFKKRTHETVNRRIVRHYQGAGCPWFFTRHWSGAWGVSEFELDDARNFIDANL